MINHELQSELERVREREAVLSECDVTIGGLRFACSKPVLIEIERLRKRDRDLWTLNGKLKGCGDPVIDDCLGTDDPTFTAFVATLPEAHWSKYDLSAVKIGWHYGRLALTRELASAEPVAWRKYPDEVPPPDTECVVEVSLDNSTYRAVDVWEQQHEAPLEWSSATVATGMGWSAHGHDVRRWIPIANLTAPRAPAVPDSMTDDPSWDEFSEIQMAYRDGWNACRAAMLAAVPKPCMLAAAPEVPRV